MKFAKLLRSFFGIDDKKQAEKTLEVSQYLDEKKESFRKDLKKIKAKAIKVGRATTELKDTVDDIVNKMNVIATGRKYNE